MVRMEELPEELQGNVERLYKRIKEMDNDPEALKHLGAESKDEILGCTFAIVAIRGFRGGTDSRRILEFEEDINILEGCLRKIGERELFRDLLELEWCLKKEPLTKKSYCPFG